MFLFQMISVLLISITFCTYLANIIFRAAWPLNIHQQTHRQKFPIFSLSLYMAKHWVTTKQVN